MNRIFHARIAAGQYLFLLIATAVTIHEMWMKHAVLTITFMLLLIIAIERLIHTTYTLTADGRLILYFGRFTRSKEIPLKDITSVERASSMKIGRFAVMRYVLVRYGTKGKCAVLLPVKEDMFIKTLTERLSGETPQV
ncbi:PH domain-containing protein [uncultured Bacteroides sp.]|uniref:PH domain-containing protein n=1 Tax=uncultured Bacteroides sp. TaxID=162156 RepID=UPI0025FF6804|nr:PH domain-containing protein [uncultured Bacteroides sp.]